MSVNMRLLIIALLLTSCTVAIVPTTTPTVTPWLTNTPTVTSTPTPDATPTAEIGCVPLSYGKVWEDTYLYVDPGFTKKVHSILHTDGTWRFDEIPIKAGTTVLFLYGRTVEAQMVVMVNGLDETGWIPVRVLSEGCQ